MEYTPYGESWVDEGSNKNVIGYRFTSKELDTETGLYYFGARYLDPLTSRWVSTDPALEKFLPERPVDDEARERNGQLPGIGGVFNPVKYVDPDGEIPLLVITGAAGAVIGGGIETYRSYQEEGQINWGRVGKGAAIGGAIGLGAGAGASLAASTAMGGTSLTLTATQTYAGFAALVQGGTAATLWGASRDGVNQGIRHFYEYAKTQPQRLASIAQRLGIGTLQFNKEGFEKFTNAAMNVVKNWDKIGGLMRTVGDKAMYYYNGVVVVMYDGKLQSVMRATEEAFNKMN